MFISLVSPQSFTEKDLEWLALGGEALYIKMSPLDWVKGWAGMGGPYTFWTIGDEQGMLVTSLRDHPEGRELYVDLIVGKGLVVARNEIKSELWQIAKRCGARWVGGNVIRPGLERIYKSFGMKPIARVMVAEV